MKACVKISAAMAFAAGCAAWCMAAVTVQSTCTYEPGGWFTSPYFTYSYEVSVTSNFNRVEITLHDVDSIDLGSYSGPGVASIVHPPPPPAGKLRIDSTGPYGFTSPLSFTIETVTNPKTVEGGNRVEALNHGISEGWQICGTSWIDAPFIVGVLTQTFDPGTFDAFGVVDLFQNTTLDGFSVHMGTATANADGSALVVLNRELTSDALYVGQDGAIIGRVVPGPAGVSLLALGGLCANRRRR